MPTYDYICKKCEHRFERFQSIVAEPERICPVCGEDSAMRKISGGAGLNFKGSGFYITDYKNGKSGSESTNTDTKGTKSDKNTDT